LTTQYVGSAASITPSIKYQKDLAECDVKLNGLKKQLKILSHKNLRTFVLSATTLSITTFNVATLSTIIIYHNAECICDECFILFIVMLNVLMLGVVVYTECHNAE
jgi:hypothetical protein